MCKDRFRSLQISTLASLCASTFALVATPKLSSLEIYDYMIWDRANVLQEDIESVSQDFPYTNFDALVATHGQLPPDFEQHTRSIVAKPSTIDFNKSQELVPSIDDMRKLEFVTFDDSTIIVEQKSHLVASIEQEQHTAPFVQQEHDCLLSTS